MAHRSFGTVRVGAEREPITFDFGLYGEERLTVIPEPSLGDTFDLYDAPEFDPLNSLEATRALAGFIRRLLDPDDVPKFNAALHRIPATQSHVIFEAAQWITEQITPFDSPPPVNSSAGRRRTGTTSRPRRAGKRT